ncbi:unnamed protein product, partial [Iphiclides podalirius]
MTLDRGDSFCGKIQPATSVSCLSQCQNLFGKRLKRWGSTGSWVKPNSSSHLNIDAVPQGKPYERVEIASDGGPASCPCRRRVVALSPRVTVA